MRTAKEALHSSIELLDDGAIELINGIVERLLVAVDFDYTYSTREEEELSQQGWEDLRTGNTISLDDFIKKHG